MRRPHNRLSHLAALSLGLLAAGSAAAQPDHAVSSKIDRAQMAAEVMERLRPYLPKDRMEGFAGLEKDSTFVNSKRGRLRSIYGGEVAGLNNPRVGDMAAADDVVRGFLAGQAGVLSVPANWSRSRSLELLESRGERSQRLTYQQRHDGMPVFDGVFAALFNDEGGFEGISGAPWPVARMPKDSAPKIKAAQAEKLAVKQVERSVERYPKLAEGLTAKARLGVSGRLQRVVWQVEVRHDRGLGVERSLWVDAVSGEILRDEDLIAAAERLDVRYLTHPGGVNNSTSHTVGDINVNPVEIAPGICLVRLQRLGSGRARMWNARLSGGTNTNPLFSATLTLGECNDLSAIDLFERTPSATADETFRFNEQSAYVRAQILKSQIDDWGRNPGASYGYYYPVDSGRDVNVEIVVNGDSARENDWCGFGVMHGCVRSGAPDDWFPGVDDPKAVFLFNSSGNSGSPQFVGPEFTASYSIIAHEVGHFISWTYGSWDGATSNEDRSLNEGMSMALAAMWGKVRWPSLDYADSIEVTTGSRIGGNQWSHHNAGSPSTHDSLDCTAANAYQLAWPWVEAIWELAHNTNVETGESIWTSASAARANTADFLMDLLYTQAGVSGRDWNDMANRMIAHQVNRHVTGREQGVRPNFESIFRVIDVLDHHGLLDSCQ